MVEEVPFVAFFAFVLRSIFRAKGIYLVFMFIVDCCSHDVEDGVDGCSVCGSVISGIVEVNECECFNNARCECCCDNFLNVMGM